jgi:hypothetical protein
VIFGIGEMKTAIKENLNGRKDKFLKLIKQTQKTLDSVGGDLKVIEKNLMKKKG